MMKKIINIFIVMAFLVVSVNSVVQDELYDYEFETGSGSTIIDSTNNSLDISHNGMFWTTTNVNDVYAIDTDGDSYAEGIVDLFGTGSFSQSLWFRSYSDSRDSIFSYFDNSNNLVWKIELDRDNNLNNLRLVYKNNLSQQITISIDSVNFNDNLFHHIAFSYDKINQEFKYYRDGVLKSSYQNVEIYAPSNNVSFRIGTSQTGGDTFDGIIDSMRLFNFVVDMSQIQDLYLNNNITYVGIVEPEIVTPDDTYLGFGLNPNDFTATQYCIEEGFEKFESYESVETLEQDVYTFDNEWKLINLNEFVMMDLVCGNNQLAEASLEISIINNQSQLIQDPNLYLVTPCLDENNYIPVGFNKYTTDLNRKRPNYILPLGTGTATFNLLSNTKYDFCLVNGKINNLKNGFNTNFDIVDVTKQIELGLIQTNDNTLKSLSLKLNNQDINNFYAPSFWGKTIEGLFQLIISLLLGGTLIIIGLKSESEKLVLIGGLILITGLGVTITTFVGVLL